MAFGKVPLKERVAGGLRKAFMTTLMLGGVASYPAYQYGTNDTFEAKVISQIPECSTSDTDCDPKYTFETSAGNLINEKSFMHLKSNEDAESIYSKLNNGSIYRFKTYGIDFGPFSKKVLSATLVTDEELAERKRRQEEAADEKRKAAAAARQQAAPAQGQPQAVLVQGQPVYQQVPGQAPVVALSGLLATYNFYTADQRYVVQITIPVEANGKITINSVTPVVQVQPVQQVQPQYVPQPQPQYQPRQPRPFEY